MKLNEARVGGLYRVEAIYSDEIGGQDPMSLGIELGTSLKVLAISGKTATVLANDQQLVLNDQLANSLEVSQVAEEADVVDTGEQDKAVSSPDQQAGNGSLPMEEPAAKPVATGIKVVSILFWLLGLVLMFSGIMLGWFEDFPIIVPGITLFIGIESPIMLYFVFKMNRPEGRQKNSGNYYLSLLSVDFLFFIFLVMNLLLA